ncbi:tyrosine-type recombinase/integrase [Salipiger thiooxidans]|uniref:tyrosine-type recombinase/integrase n=1 Tax=Salipiger thiooxidans TaxID=282683 RepID=UPI001CFC1093|nr:tyrosine-type recombinase/integrase [Salipiger thiooxidans]
MAGDIRLERYVQRKLARGREYFFFRVVRDGKETRKPLPHPFDPGYRSAYNAAHREAFGTVPGEFESPRAITRLVREHKDSVKYSKLPKASRLLRDYALDLMTERWGEFEADQIRPIHVQAVYDSLSERPATANRRLDDMSAVFSWGRTRGFSDENPCRRIERVQSDESYEPWPDDQLELLISKGKRHIVKVALVALYTGQRRADVIGMCENQIRDGIWSIEQGKTGNAVTLPLHPVVLAIIEEERAARRKAQVVAPALPLLTNSRGKPWGLGFGASWTKELIRIGLRPKRMEEMEEDAFRPTFHGLRTTNATVIANTVARNPDLFGGIQRVQAMLGHLSERMSRHYARRAEVEHMNRETVLLLPDFGKHISEIGKHEADEAAK